MPRDELRALLQQESVRLGEFTLKSGATSNFYIDCRLTALHARGAVLIGQVLYPLILEKAQSLNVAPRAIGGLTMGADPVSVSIAMRSALSEDGPLLHA
ncbi:MAG: orotate phosphoribosyltransferase, partial [Verrucomicrobiota bacterium]